MKPYDKSFYLGMLAMISNLYSWFTGHHEVAYTILAFLTTVQFYVHYQTEKLLSNLLDDYGNLADHFSDLLNKLKGMK